ncbi:hypothetical protein HPHPP26_1196 [Helicobacter pylori Hp P-26]|nr:hypothetical protein HPHPP26_1196 [Helicobacter pylori Hp P-26]
MNYDVLMGFLALILLILWYVYGLRQYLKLKDENKRVNYPTAKAIGLFLASSLHN